MLDEAQRHASSWAKVARPSSNHNSGSDGFLALRVSIMTIKIQRMNRFAKAITLSVFLAIALMGQVISAEWTDYAQSEFPLTDFGQRSIDLNEVLSGGPPRDGIPPIDDPEFKPIDEVDDLAETEPVVGLIINGEARAYPLSVMIWHEIVNDTVGGIPVAVTYCPLCNTAIVFDRRLGNRVLDFGTTGRLRNSDLLMYDRQTESWWQQFLGEALIGALTGERLTMIPARLESFANFRDRTEQAQVLVPGNVWTRRYGGNPYTNYDSSPRPFLYRGALPANIAPLERVVRVEDQAWSLPLLQDKGSMDVGDLRLTWQPGQNSAVDASRISDGRDVGNVIVQKQSDDGWEDVAYSVDFAFAFTAFYPEGTLHTE